MYILMILLLSLFPDHFDTAADVHLSVCQPRCVLFHEQKVPPGIHRGVWLLLLLLYAPKTRQRTAY